MIGLMHMAFTVIDISEALHVTRSDLSPFKNFCKYIRKSNSLVIRKCLRSGLPSTAAVEIDVIVRCIKCGGNVTRVSCQACSTTEDPSPYERSDFHDLELIEPAGMTEDAPGTIGKIEIMRVRIEMGESAFHSGDAIKATNRTPFIQGWDTTHGEE